MSINLTLLITALLCSLSFTVWYVFQKTRNPGTTFLKGFAYPVGIIAPFIIYLMTPESLVPRWMDKEIFSVVMALIIFWTLTRGFEIFWKVKSTLKKTFRFVRKMIVRRSFRWGLWQVSFPRKK